MMEIYLVRHGETEFNRSGLYYGSTDCPLSSNGIKQCFYLSNVLINENFDVVIASTLRRAIETASIISGLNEQKIIKDCRLNEINFGEWEGKHYTEISETYKNEWKLWSRDWKNASPPSGESFISMYRRVKECLEEIKSRHKDKKVLIVSHNGCLKVIATLLLGLSEDFYWSFNFEHGRYSIFQIENGNCTIKRINCI